MTRTFKIARKFSVLILFVLTTQQTQAQTSSYGELHAAYLYNFAKYIKWPGEMTVFRISVLGETEIMDDLHKILKGKKISGKEIELKKIETCEDALQCQLVFLSSSASVKLGSLLKLISDKNILLVTEDDLVKKGATISFFVEDEKLRFKINQKALVKSGLQAADGLLKLGVLL